MTLPRVPMTSCGALVLMTRPPCSRDIADALRFRCPHDMLRFAVFASCADGAALESLSH